MANLNDYLEWRGDIPFTVDPFNEVDNLVLSNLAYIDFQDIVLPDNKTVSVQDAARAFFNHYPRSEFIGKKDFFSRCSLLLESVAQAPRYRELTLYYYLNEIDPGQDKQFSAVTFGLGDGTTYAAFRGTDDTVVGWKEDMNFSFQDETEGQHRAVQYLDSIRDTGLLRVGGHSKGGNLALYAAAFCEDQDRITDVYTNDSPGFRDTVTEAPGYLRILPKVTRIVPDNAIVGLLLFNKAVHRVIKSTASGLQQHDGFTWSVRRNHFEKAELSDLSKMVDDTLAGWLEKIDDKERAFFTREVFDLFESTDRETFSEIKGQKIKSAKAILSAIRSNSRAENAETLRILARLGASGKEAIGEYLNSKRGRNEPEKNSASVPDSM